MITDIDRKEAERTAAELPDPPLRLSAQQCGHKLYDGQSALKRVSHRIGGDQTGGVFKCSLCHQEVQQ